jgi:SAM-dependent methyltransferase
MAVARKDPSRIVRDGYDRMAPRYLKARSRGLPDPPLLSEFSRLLPPRAMVLDAGCGAALPVTRTLSKDHRVIGIDFSLGQLHLARQSVPEAQFACQDMTRLAFPDGIFDGICTFYAILHIPRERHEELLLAFYRLLKTPGYGLFTLGMEDNKADRGSYFGEYMFWSHFDKAAYLRMLDRIGFQLLRSRRFPDPIAREGHNLFTLVRKGGA